MLWYKAWRESRTRFTVTALVLTGLCFFAVLFDNQTGSVGLHGSERIHRLIYAGTGKGVFAFLAIFLGLGGLLREQAYRTALFTLALPVSRGQLVTTHVIVGLFEIAVLSLLPAFWIPLLSWLVQRPFPVTEALHFSPLWFVGGAMIFALAFFLSVIFKGEYTAPVACYILLMLQALLASWAPIRPYRLNLLWTMAEFPTLPWVRVLTLLLLASVLFALSMRLTQKQDF